MNQKLLGIQKFNSNEKRGVIKRRIYKISAGSKLREEVNDTYESKMSLIDMDVQLPPKHIAIEKVEAFNSEEGYYWVYYILLYNNIVGLDIDVLAFSEVDYPGYNDSQLQIYLQGYITGVTALTNNHNT